MDEAELIEVIIGYTSAAGFYFTIWLSVLSAYAITAYVAGKEFSNFQIIWINTLYVFAAGLPILGLFGGFRSQLYYIAELKKINPGSPQIMNPTILVYVTTLAVIGTIATLAFMWQIRNSAPKAK